MNERILELADKAFSEYESDTIKYEARIPDEFCLKFAELIVKECMRYFNEDYQRDFNALWREDLSASIKQHFGVKE